MANSTFDSTMRRTKVALLLSGIKLEDFKFGSITEMLFKYLFYFNFIWLGTDVVGEVFGLIEGVQLGKNFIELSLTIPCMAISFLGTAKGIFLFQHQNTIFKIIRKLKDIHPDEATELNVDDNETEGKITTESIKFLNLVNVMFTIICSAVVVAFCLLPAAAMAYTFYTTGKIVYEYPYLTKYFFNHYTLERWPFVYFHQVYSTVIVAANLMGADTLFYSLCLYVEMHFQLLCKRFEVSTVGNEIVVKKSFRNCVERHQELIQLVDNMEVLYTKSTLFNILMSSVLICLNGFILTMTSDVTIMIMFMTFLSMNLSQTYLLCYFGDLLMKSSAEVSSAIYNSLWYLSDATIGKHLLLVQMRAQKPCKLTALGFADVNQRAFMRILSNAWSFFALLNTMFLAMNIIIFINLNIMSKKNKALWMSFDDSLKNTYIPCRLIGLNFQNRARNQNETITFWINMIWMNLAFIGCFHWMYDGTSKGILNFTEITYVAPGTMLTIIANFKAFFAYAYENKIKTLINNLRKLDQDIDVSKLNETEMLKVKSAVNFLNRVIRILNVLNIMMLLVYDLSPIVLMITKYYKTKVLELMLPFLDIYPFYSFDLRWWPFLYIHQIWAEAIVLLQICSVDYLFYICCTYIRIHFILLQYQIEQIVPHYGSYVDYIEFEENFVRLIKCHQDLISTANMLEVIISESTLSNFVISSIVICLTGFNVMTTNDFAAIMTFITFLFMSLLQVFFLCFFGDMLMTSSSDVSNAVYSCKWYLSDASACKNIIIVQIRSQKPCKVTAAGFADVNLRAYMKILSTSWSYFALLQTMYGSVRT
ncbi:uncharacterized protein LOC106138459 [Amyelois transitella]|uniref:uncharacterized protein LOC106138459 n=1 Tax=Amyelois transitella TaxID=680683 RepID=UPI00298F593F|nr:uncharacterized protein LOC106138459 [Amyelois transitella]